MAKVSEVREETLNRGYKWTADRYQYAIDKGAEKDEDFALPKKARERAPGSAPNAFAAAMSLPNAALSGATMGLTDKINPVYPIDSGSPFVDTMFNKVALPTAQGLGMALPMMLAPQVAIPRALAEGGWLARMLGRSLSAAPSFSAYEGGRGAIEGYRNAEGSPTLTSLMTGESPEPNTNDRLMNALAGFMEGSVRGAGTGVALGAIKVPEKLGGAYTGAGLGLGGLTAVEGGSPSDIAGAMVAGPVMHSIGVESRTPSGERGGRRAAKVEKEAKAAEAKKLEQLLADFHAEQQANQAFNELGSKRFEDLTPTRQESAQEKKWRKEQAAYSPGQKSIFDPGSKPAMAGDAALELVDAPPDARTKPNEGPKVPLLQGMGPLYRTPLTIPEKVASGEISPEEAAALAPSLAIPGLRRPGSVIDPTARGETGGPIEVVPGGAGEPVGSPAMRRPGQTNRPELPLNTAEELGRAIVDEELRTYKGDLVPLNAPEFGGSLAPGLGGGLGEHNPITGPSAFPKPGFLRTAEDRIPPDSQDARRGAQPSEPPYIPPGVEPPAPPEQGAPVEPPAPKPKLRPGQKKPKTAPENKGLSGPVIDEKPVVAEEDIRTPGAEVVGASALRVGEKAGQVPDVIRSIMDRETDNGMAAWWDGANLRTESGKKYRADGSVESNLSPYGVEKGVREIEGSPEYFAYNDRALSLSQEAKARIESERAAKDAEERTKRQDDDQKRSADYERRAKLDAQSDLTGWKKSTMSMYTDQGPKPTEGYERRGLFIHKYPGTKTWKVSHSSSGKHIGVERESLTDAKFVADRLSREADWTSPESEVMKDSAHLGSAVVALRRSWASGNRYEFNNYAEIPERATTAEPKTKKRRPGQKKPPEGDVTLGTMGGGLEQLGRLAIPVEPSAPLKDVALDRGLWAHREGGSLQDMVREIPRLGEVSREVKADIARVAKEVGDVRSPAALFSDPVEALSGIAGGKPGTPLDQALLGPQSALEHGRIIQKERWRKPLDDAIETLKIKPGDKVDSAFGDIGEQISRGDVHTPTEQIAVRPAVQDIAKTRKLSPDELRRAIEFAKIGRTFSDQVRFDVNTARSASGRREIPYIDKYVTWMRRNSFMDSMRGIGRFVGEGGGSLSPSYLHPSEKINPRALSRGKELTYERETSGIKLLESYLDISSKDIFYNAGIKHYRALAHELANAGMTNAAQKLNRIVDVQMGLKAPLTEQIKDAAGMNTGPAYAARKGAEWISRNWFQNIFKWNLKFPLKTQAFGLAAAPAMYGQRAAGDGMVLIANPEWRSAWNKQGQIGALKRVQEGRITQSEGLERGRQSKGKLDQIGYGLMNGMEDFTTMYGSAVAYSHGYHHGLRGRALWDYSDIGGKRIAGFYGSYLKPDIISGKSISLLAPMQSFNFQMASNLASAMGARTGSYKMQAGEGAKGAAMRTYMVGRWLAWMVSANLLSEKLGLGTSWQIPGSAIPFGDILTGGASESPKIAKGVSKLLGKPTVGGMEIIPTALGATSRGAEDSGKPWIGEATKDFYDGVAAMIKSDSEGKATPNWVPLRKFALNYLWPKGGGVQAERIIEAAEAFAQGGEVKDAAGSTMYTIPEGPQTVASFAFGPSGTPAAREDKSLSKGGDSRPTRRAIPKR